MLDATVIFTPADGSPVMTFSYPDSWEFLEQVARHYNTHVTQDSRRHTVVDTLSNEVLGTYTYEPNV